ncbi:MAG: aminotransferase class IV [Terrimesophilobacter sp.]
MVTISSFLWNSDRLEPEDDGDVAPIAVADSWLVAEGKVMALELHRARFFAAIAPAEQRRLRLEVFWAASLARLPLTGHWFPRVELRLDSAAQRDATQHDATQHDGTSRLAFRLRRAPSRSTSLTVATHPGHDPRRQPNIKGPDIAALATIRHDAQLRGADEAIILSETGQVVDGASTAILWWRGQTLCAPPTSLARVDSVTAKTLLAIATALGTEIRYEAVQPRKLDALEVWAVNALHGIRTVTAWIEGPAMAAESSRASVWRARMTALTTPLAPTGQ